MDVFFGQGKFIDKNTIAVDGHVLKFARAVIATGGRPGACPVRVCVRCVLGAGHEGIDVTWTQLWRLL